MTTIQWSKSRQALKDGLRQMGLEGCRRALKACIETPHKVELSGAVHANDDRH